MRMRFSLAMRFAVAAIVLLMLPRSPAQADPPATVRVATVNASLYRKRAGELYRDLSKGNNKQALSIANILRRVRPDIVLINEIDYDAENRCAATLRDMYLASRDGLEGSPIAYPHLFSAPVNTGMPSGMDLDGNKSTDGAEDAWGYGAYPGQYGMAILSMYPIDVASVRTFQNFLWSRLPGALRPSGDFYSDAVWNRLRLSSKSHWDVPILIGGKTLHILASHPTPPVFDGPEDRNGCRNHDEIRFWTEYIGPATDVPFIDDQGRSGPLAETSSFVIVGDMNADPIDGTGRGQAIRALIEHARVQDPRPSSQGAVESAKIKGGINRLHKADSKTDTASFSARAVGNLRIDFALPSSDLSVAGSEVFWPAHGEPDAEWINASDHRLVWVDLRADSIAK